MIEHILTALSEGLQESAGIALAVAFAWGLASILLSPCHLASIPLIVGYVNGGELPAVRRAFVLSTAFACGVVVAVAAVGAVTWWLGRLVGDLGGFENYLLVGLLALFGLMLLDVVPLPALWQPRSSERRGFAGALLLGSLYGVGLGPCTFAFAAPVIVLVFAEAGPRPWLAAGLLIAFALGHSVVLVAAGTAGDRVGKLLGSTGRTRRLGVLRKACGGLLLVAAGYVAVTRVLT